MIEYKVTDATWHTIIQKNTGTDVVSYTSGAANPTKNMVPVKMRGGGDISKIIIVNPSAAPHLITIIIDRDGTSLAVTDISNAANFKKFKLIWNSWMPGESSFVLEDGLRLNPKTDALRIMCAGSGGQAAYIQVTII